MHVGYKTENNKQKNLIDTDNRIVVTTGEGHWGRIYKVKWIEYMVTKETRLWIIFSFVKFLYIIKKYLLTCLKIIIF